MPDFSIRFVDESYRDANAMMQTIQDRMDVWFDARGTELARKGLTALRKSSALIVYLPWQTAHGLGKQQRKKARINKV